MGEMVGEDGLKFILNNFCWFITHLLSEMIWIDSQNIRKFE